MALAIQALNVIGLPPKSICTEKDQLSTNALVAQLFLALSTGIAAYVTKEAISSRALLITASVGGFADLGDSVIGRCGSPDMESSFMSLVCVKGALRAAVILWGLHAAKAAPAWLSTQTLPLALTSLALVYDFQYVARNSTSTKKTWI